LMWPYCTPQPHFTHVQLNKTSYNRNIYDAANILPTALIIIWHSGRHTPYFNTHTHWRSVFIMVI